MKSSSGQYFIGLDHVRALAAFMVFTWHFLFFPGRHLAPPPMFPLSLLAEGHTGVALFMVLSGYLFAKLLSGKRIVYRSFIWNRFLRLAPLLTVVVLVVGVQLYLKGFYMPDYWQLIAEGVIKPTMPNGGWSITAEFHFYLMLPALLYLTRKWKYSLLVVLVTTVLGRTLLFEIQGEIQSLSFWTIVGRVDQFVLGILAYQFRNKIAGRHVAALLGLLLFAGFFWYFDSQGGFFRSRSYPSPSPIWIYLPTMEGLGYALGIAWYDNSFQHSTGFVSRFIARIGTYSYSIYLLHFFFVWRLSQAVDTHVVSLANIYTAMLWSGFCFLLMIPIGHISYTYLESPFLGFRTRYIVAEGPTAEAAAAPDTA